MSYLVGSSVIDDKPYFLCHIFILAIKSHILENMQYIIHIFYWNSDDSLIKKKVGNGADVISEYYG